MSANSSHFLPLPQHTKKKKKKSVKNARLGKISRNTKYHSESTVFSLKRPYGSERGFRPTALERTKSRNRLGIMVPSARKNRTIKRNQTLMTTSRIRRNAVLQRVAQKIKRKNPETRIRAGTFTGFKNKSVTELNRGGVHIVTSVGAIQLGLPPETIKDVLSAGLMQPKYYIVPKERFNLQLGVSCAEIEFPMFFSFFIKGTVVTLITDRDTESEIDIIVRESTIGPEPKNLFVSDEYCEDKKHEMPNHIEEINHFKVDKKMINYRFYDDKRVVNLTDESGGHVIVFDNEVSVCFEIFDYKAFLANQLSSEILAKSEYYPNMSVQNIFFQLKKDQYDQTLLDCFHIVSYDSAERIGNIYEKVDGEVIPENVDEFEYEEEDFSNTKTRSIQIKAEKLRKEVKSSSFKIPDFGITILGNSHGFDKDGTTTGFVVWINGHGIMVDPPPHSSFVLERAGISPKTITAIILTHCHADHDAGTFQKMITDHKIDLITSATIYNSFVRKYSAVSGLSTNFLKSLFNYRAIYLGEPNYWKGATIEFFYSLHSIPCLGFKINLKGKSMVYSADTYYSVKGLEELRQKGVLSKDRAHQLLNFPWDCDLVLHEAGVPPLHTPIESFMQLTRKQRDNIRLIHVAGKEAAEAKANGLKIAKTGVENTIRIIESSPKDEKIKLLKIISSMEIFSHFSVEKTLELVYMAEYEKVPVGRVDTGDKFIIVISGLGLAKVKDCERILTEGSFFGELVFAGSLESTGTEFEETDSDTDERSYSAMRSDLKSEEFEAVTDMEILKLNFYAIKNLIVEDEMLANNMIAIVQARQLNSGWTAIESNSILKQLQLGQKLELQSKLIKFEVEEGKIVSGRLSGPKGRLFPWKKDSTIKYAILVESGTLAVDLPGNFTDPLLLDPGMLAFEYINFGAKYPRHDLTLRAIQGKAVVYAIKNDDFKKLLIKNPRLMLSFYKTDVVY